MKIPTLLDCAALKVMALYDTEHEILKALPKVIKNVTNPKLKEALSVHLKETEGHVERLDAMFEAMNVKPKKTKVEAIRGLIDDTEWCMKQVTVPATLDMLMIGAARHVEHYEISGYLTLIDLAKMLSLEEVAELAEQTLEEEKNADSTLSMLAEEVATEADNGSTDKAVSTDETEEEEGDEDQ